jgi:AcrR family transcriptional regulator
VARTKITLELAPLFLVRGADDDGILDAAAQLIASYGLKRWTIDDVADLAGVGRTTVYRAYGNREALVHAVLARELRMTLAVIQEATRGHRTLEDQLAEAAITALEALDGSLVDSLLRTDPVTVLPLLTTGAGPLMAIAREAIAARLRAAGVEAGQASQAAEVAARLGVSFVLTRDTVLPVRDPAAMRETLRRLLRPLLQDSTRRRAKLSS